METDKRSRVVKGGLEFIPLPEGETEDDYKVAHGRPHPCQLSLLEGLDSAIIDGGRRRGAQRE